MLGGFFLGILMKRRRTSQSGEHDPQKRNGNVIDSDENILNGLISENTTSAANNYRQFMHNDDELPSQSQSIHNSGITLKLDNRPNSTECEERQHDHVTTRMREILDESVTRLEIAQDMPVCLWQFARDVSELVADILQQFDLSNDMERLHRFTDQMQNAFLEGLRQDYPEIDGHVEMLSTFISSFATRDSPDSGRYIGLELAGLNLRFSLLQQDSDIPDYKLIQRSFKIPRIVASSDSQQLMAYIASMLKEFTEQYGANSENLPLGVTIAMPLKHSGIKDCHILKLPSSYGNTTGVIGKPVAQLLTDAVDHIESLDIQVCL